MKWCLLHFKSRELIVIAKMLAVQLIKLLFIWFVDP